MMRAIAIILLGGFILFSCHVDKKTAKGIIPRESKEVDMDTSSVDTNMVYKIVEQMPRFKLCDEKMKNEDELRKCSDTALIIYINKHLRMSQIEIGKGIESTTGVARFTVNTDGSISDVEILREFVATESFKKAIENMPKWERVGKHKGKKVKVSITMPIRINLAM